MAKTLTIAASNFLPQYVSSSAEVTEFIQSQPNVMNMEIAVKSGQSKPTQGSEIVFKDDTRFLFGGYITRVTPREYGEGEFFHYVIEATDYGWIFNNKRARKAYSDSTLKAIVEDLLDTYMDSSYGFTTTNVQTGPTIETVTFDHISIRKCFEKLSKLTGFIWWVDYEKNVYFQEKDDTAAPEQITDTSDNYSEISISYDTTQVRNSVIVIGSDDGEQSDSTTTETFYGDGETRAWQLEDKPSEVVSIKLNDVSKQFSLDLNERDTDVFTYSFSGQSFRLTDDQTTPTGDGTEGTSDEIEIEYYPRVPIIRQRQDEDSIAFFAAKDGGDGIYEYTIKESSITSKAQAQSRADDELSEFADPLASGVFKTRTSLLAGGSVFAPGQILTVNLPTWGLSTDTAFLIQQVDVELVEDGSTTEYLYTVRFGGKVVDVETFLQTLAGEGEEVQNTDEIKTIFGTTDAVEMADNAPTRTLFTPPFEYGPSGSPQSVWNKSEWS